MSIYSEEHKIDENYLRQHLETYCRNENISMPEFIIDKCCGKGDNFTGHLYRVVITGKVNGESKKIHGILKLATRSKKQRMLMPAIRPFFVREILFYTYIVPLFKEAAAELQNIPKLLYASDQELNEALLLEDLSIREFVSMKKENCMNKRESKLLDYEHASLALRYLGKYHANSFIVREKRPDIFEKLQAIEEPLFLNPERSSPYVHMILNIIKPIIDNDANEYQKMKFGTFEQNFVHHLQFALNSKNAEPFAVVCHGDLWSNNMMFKYDENRPDPKDVYFLDFQSTRYTSPITDIAYMIFCSSDPDMRKEKYQDLLKNYHDSLSDALKEAGLNPEKVFSFDEFLQEISKFASYAGVMAVFTKHLFTAADGDYLPEFGTKNIEEPLRNMLNNNDVYKKCIRHLYYELIEKQFI